MSFQIVCRVGVKEVTMRYKQLSYFQQHWWLIKYWWRGLFKRV